MRRVLLQMFMTLDGVAEFPDYADESPETWSDVNEAMWTGHWESIDTLLLGRIAYEKWYGFWPGVKSNPNSAGFSLGFSKFADRVEKVVFSKTLPSAAWENSRIVRGDLGEEIRRLKGLPGKHLALGGGPRIAQAFLREGLVDDLYLTMFPSLVGKGKPIFDVIKNPENPKDNVPIGTPGRHDFKLIEAKPLRSGSVFLHYEAAPRT